MDQYIDNNETQTYGDRFTSNLRLIFGADAPEAVRTIMVWCADRVATSTLAMRTAMASSRGALSARSHTSEEKLAAVVTARHELRSFALHLAASRSDQRNPWNGDPNLFFPGGRSSIGEGARNVRDATAIARNALEGDPTVPARAAWSDRLDAQVAALDPLVARGDEAERAGRTTLSEQSSEKRAWLRTYRGAALVLEGLLLMVGRESEYTAAVPHLTAPNTRKRRDGVPNAPIPTPVG